MRVSQSECVRCCGASVACSSDVFDDHVRLQTSLSSLRCEELHPTLGVYVSDVTVSSDHAS